MLSHRGKKTEGEKETEAERKQHQQSLQQRDERDTTLSHLIMIPSNKQEEDSRLTSLMPLIDSISVLKFLFMHHNKWLGFLKNLAR